MPWEQFYAASEDLREVLNFVFEEADSHVFATNLEYDRNIRKFKSASAIAGALSDPSNEATLVERFEKGSPAVRQATFRAYLGIADSLIATCAKRTEGMYVKLYGASSDAGETPGSHQTEGAWRSR